MKKASLIVEGEFFLNNRIFDLTDSVANRDNCLLPFFRLRESFKQHGICLATSDIHSENISEISLYNEMPRTLPQGRVGQKRYLLLFESELIRPENWSIKNHDLFDKIFTCNDDFVDNKKYFKINFSHQMPATINKKIDKAKLCTMIAGNKKVKHPLELYSKRVEVIRWFEKHHLKDFDLYGIGWDEYQFQGPKIVRALNIVKPLKKILAEKHPSYRGRVESKKDTLEQYKFSICFENARDISGYITEKIFDCFFAGCVPVYWGANNVTDHIPSNCFIDIREFSCYEDMYHYMTSMTDSEYTSYLDAIDLFLHSEAASQFTVDFFANTIVNHICETNEV